MNTADKLSELYHSQHEGIGKQAVVRVSGRFNLFSRDWLHIGPEGTVTDEVWTVTYMKMKEASLFRSAYYQHVLFRKDNGECLVDRNSTYIKSSIYLGTPYSETGVYEGNRTMILGGSIVPVTDKDRAQEIINLMRERIDSAYTVNVKSKDRKLGLV